VVEGTEKQKIPLYTRFRLRVCEQTEAGAALYPFPELFFM
jgi:hypothetical protein